MRGFADWRERRRADKGEPPSACGSVGRADATGRRARGTVGSDVAASKAFAACVRICVSAAVVCALVAIGICVGSNAGSLGDAAWADEDSDRTSAFTAGASQGSSGGASASGEARESSEGSAASDASTKGTAYADADDAGNSADVGGAANSGGRIGSAGADDSTGETADASSEASPDGRSEGSDPSMGLILRAPRASQVKRADPLGSLAPEKTVEEFAYIESLNQDAMEFKTRYPDDIKYLSTPDTAASNWEGLVHSIVARLPAASEGSWGEVDYSGSESSPVLSLVWRNAGYTSKGRSLDVRLDVAELTLVRAGTTAKTWQSIMDYRGGKNGGFNFNAQANSWVKSSKYDGEGTAGYKLQNDVQIRCTIRLCEVGTEKLVDAPVLMTWKDIDQPGYPGVSYYEGEDNPYKDYWHGKNGGVSDWNEQVLLGDGFDASAYVDPATYLDVTTGITKGTIGWEETPDVLGSSTWTRFAATRGEDNEKDHDAVKLAAMSTYLYGGKGTFIWRGYGCSTAMFSKMTAPPHVPPDVGLKKTPETQTLERGQRAVFDISTQATGSNSEGIIPYTYTGASSNAYRSIVFSDELDAAFDATEAVVTLYRTDMGKGTAEADDTPNWDISVTGQSVRAACKDTTTAGGRYRMRIEVPVREDANLDAYEVRTVDGLGSVRVVPNAGVLTISDDVLKTKEIKTGPVEVYVPQHSIEVMKVDAESGDSLPGAVFGLYKDAECKNGVGSATTDDEGKAVWTEYAEADGGRTYLIEGRTFYVKETSAPSGYRLDEAVRPVAVGGSVSRIEVRDSRTPTSWTLKARKTLVGADDAALDLNAGQFSFELQEVDDKGAPLGQAKVADNDADGMVAFDPIEFVAAGTHRYQVSEVHPDTAEKGIQYDGEIYMVEVSVVPDSSNALTAREKVSRSDGTSCDAVTFENRYRENHLPQTGSPSAPIAVAAGMGAVAAGVLLYRMRRMCRGS